MIVAYSAFSRFIFFEKFSVQFEDSNHDRIRMDAVGALVCVMGWFFLLQWHSPAGISDIVDSHSKSGTCCSGITVPDEDAGTGHSIESSDS